MPVIAPPTLTPAGASPDRADRATFSARSVARDDFIKNVQIPELQAALNNVFANATEVVNIAALMNLNATTDTSVSSVLIGSGEKSFTVSAGKSFVPGMWLSLSDTAEPSTNSMVGQVTSYTGTALVVNVPTNAFFGSGTKTAWTISLTSALSTGISGAMAPVASAATLAAGRAALGAELEPGAVMPYARNTAPSGWLKANGALISRNTYAALFAAIGTTFGVGDGSTTFAVPDLRGEFLRGWDDGRGVDSGRAFGSAQAQDLQPHTHSMPNQQVGLNGTSGSSMWTVTNVATATSSTGTTETRPRNIALLACIKY